MDIVKDHSEPDTRVATRQRTGGRKPGSPNQVASALKRAVLRELEEHPEKSPLQFLMNAYTDSEQPMSLRITAAHRFLLHSGLTPKFASSSSDDKPEGNNNQKLFANLHLWLVGGGPPPSAIAQLPAPQDTVITAEITGKYVSDVSR
jgi:hypothetical protein